MFLMTLILFLLPQDLEFPEISRNLLSSLSELGNNSTHMGNEVPCTPIPNSSAGVSGDMSLENSKCERIK